MDFDDQPNMLYHSLHKRVRLRGCLPIALVLACAAIGGLMLALNIHVPQRVHPRGEGRVYYNNRELMHFQIRHRTPLPLNIPSYADPARQEAAAAVVKDGRVKASLMPSPAFDFLFIAPDSVVLGEADLLALPPEKEAAPAPQETEAQTSPEPAGEAPAPAAGEPAPAPAVQEGEGVQP